MKCEDLLRLLNDYVEGSVDPELCETFEKHLEGCNPCQIVVDNIRRTITLYKNGEAYELPAELRTRLHDRLRARWGELHGEEPPGPHRSVG